MSNKYSGSKADLLKKYGPKILKLYGKEELDSIKLESSGPGGVGRLRIILEGMDAATMARGGVAKKKMMRGGMAAKTSPKRMRGGGMMKAASKKMMRGGMAKKKK